MKIGIDFDNTIVNYDNLFYECALRMGLIPSTLPHNKKVIRDLIRTLPEGNKRWTELQGNVYGIFISEAKPSKGIELFFEMCEQTGIQLIIISHKTEYPASGPKVNLRDKAKNWMKSSGIGFLASLNTEQILFKDTLEGKIFEIRRQNCSFFIDDMIEIFLHPEFPSDVKKILYTSRLNNQLDDCCYCFNEWKDISDYIIKELHCF